MSNDLPGTLPGSEQEPSNRVADAASNASDVESPAEIGAYLARLRVEQGKSLAHAASYLKVAPAKLEAIEAGDMARLPDATFAVGLVRSYAKMLGVNSDKRFPALKAAYGVQVPDLSLPVSSGVQLSRRRVVMNWRDSASRRGRWRNGWLLGCVLVAIAAALLLIWRNGHETSGWWSHRFQTTSSSAVHENVLAIGKEKSLLGTQTASPEIVSPTQPNALGEAGYSNAVTNVASASVADAVGIAATSSAPAVAVPVAPPVSNVVTSDAQALVTPATEAPQTASTAQGLSTLTMDVTQNCWVSVRQQDGQSVFEGIVYPGQTARIQGMPPLKIVLGNQQAVKDVRIDGQLVEPQRYAGHANVARFTLP